jgi:secondary thiamine-phosphate synthase enzyme
MPVKTITVQTPKQGLFEFTHQVNEVVKAVQVKEGLCTLFLRHTSASLLIQENADPSAKYDLENWFNRLVAERDSLYTHTSEGADDMPSHIKSALTATSLSIPILNGQLVLGTWQGIFLWEHRHHGGNRSVVIHLGEWL